MENQNQIMLVQHPVIQHRLEEIGRTVTLRLEELNLPNLIATDETIKSLKELRAELNKELADWESQRKALKEAVTTPYQQFEGVYKTEISDKYKSASDALALKIGSFEARVKADRTEALKEYLAELCATSNIDFIEWKHVGIEVLLSTSDKKYKEQLTEFVNRVADDILLIQGMDYATETMAEYKQNGLNASKAIQVVRDRKEAEKIERERVAAAENMRRTNMLRALTFVYHQLTRSYHFVSNEELYITQSDVESMSKDDFQKWYAQTELTVSASYKKEQEKTTVVEQKSAASLQAPTVVGAEPQKEKVFKAVFECSGTMSQLKALGEYLKQNGITYKNL